MTKLKAYEQWLMLEEQRKTNDHLTAICADLRSMMVLLQSPPVIVDPSSGATRWGNMYNSDDPSLGDPPPSLPASRAVADHRPIPNAAPDLLDIAHHQSILRELRESLLSFQSRCDWKLFAQILRDLDQTLAAPESIDHPAPRLVECNTRATGSETCTLPTGHYGPHQFTVPHFSNP